MKLKLVYITRLKNIQMKKCLIISFAALLNLIYQIFKLICKLLFKSNKSFFQIKMNFIFIIIIIELKKTKNFMRKNLKKSRAVAAKIFNVNIKTLFVFIHRVSNNKLDEQNKMLQDHEKNAFDNLIRSLLRHEILLISQLIFNAIVNWNVLIFIFLYLLNCCSSFMISRFNKRRLTRYD